MHRDNDDIDIIANNLKPRLSALPAVRGKSEKHVSLGQRARTLLCRGGIVRATGSDVSVTTRAECQRDRREQKLPALFVSDSTTITCRRPNGTVSLSGAAAFAILALTAVKIPQGIARERIFSAARARAAKCQSTSPRGEREGEERQWSYFVYSCHFSVYISKRSNTLPADRLRPARTLVSVAAVVVTTSARRCRYQSN